MRFQVSNDLLSVCQGHVLSLVLRVGLVGPPEDPEGLVAAGVELVDLPVQADRGVVQRRDGVDGGRGGGAAGQGRLSDRHLVPEFSTSVSRTGPRSC